MTIAPFFLGVAEVSQELWRAATGVDPAALRTFDAEDALGLHCTSYAGIVSRGDALPVVCVDFAMAARFANALSVREGLTPAYTLVDVPGAPAPEVRWDRAASGWRLPTGDEWEHAARAGRYGAEEAPEGLCATQNGADRSFLRLSPTTAGLPCDDGFAGPAPVEAFPPNAWGLRSMQGNVAEWVWAPDGDGQQEARGGHFAGVATHLRPSFTARYAPTQRAIHLGLRLARSR